MTAMYHAINDLFFASLEENERENYRDCRLLSWQKDNNGGDSIYVVSLFKQHEVVDAEPEHEEDGESTEGIEEATAVLLSKMKERFDSRRKAMLAEMDSVLSRHDGALRGARSKIREKKTT